MTAVREPMRDQTDDEARAEWLLGREQDRHDREAEDWRRARGGS